MKTGKIKILLLSFVLAILSFSVALAEEHSGTIGNGIGWVLSNGTLTLSGSGEMTKPNAADDSFEWFNYRSQIKKVVIGSGITTIGDNAFAGCYNMTSISIPEGVTTIGDGAFNSCSGLKTVSLPSTVTKIMDNAFCYCSALTSITIPAKVSSIGEYAFLSCSKLTEITFKTSAIPALTATAFEGVVATAYYQSSWSAAPTSSYGGNIKWNSVAAPKITAQPKSASIEQGYPAEFSLTASGTGLSYQWQVSTDSGKTWVNSGLAGNKTAKLSLEATSGRNGYYFRCKISDKVGKTVTSSSVKLTVLPPDVSITTQPKAVTVALGKDAVFTVAAKSNSGSTLSYQWQASADGGKTWSNSSLSGNKTSQLTVGGTLARTNYRFRCIVTNAYGSYTVTNAVKLTVKEVIRFNSQSQSQKITKEGNVKFSVAAVSLISSKLSYQWQVSTNSGETWSDSGLSGNKTATLTVGATAARNGYRFRCVVSDAKGNSLTSSAMTLTAAPAAANTKFSLSYITASQLVLSGQTVRYTVSALSKINSKLSYQWQVSTDGGKSWKTSFLSGNKTNTLSLTATSTRNNYRFRCLISDAKGNKIYTDAVKLNVK